MEEERGGDDGGGGGGGGVGGYYEVPAHVNADQAVLSLMAMTEKFRTAKTPKHKMAIKCVMASLKIQCSPELAALCNFELGKLLWLYTRNVKMAIDHLKTAYNMMKELGKSLELARLKVVCLITEIYIGERCYEDIKTLLRNEIADSGKYPIMHAKLLFLFGEVYLKLFDYDRALEVVNTGIVYFRGVKEIVLECYFRLAKSLVLSIQLKDQSELGNSVSELGEILSSVSNSVPALNDIRSFCYSIQLCYFLATGMVKSSKQCLRQLHVTVQATECQPPDTAPHFHWLSAQMLTGMAYVLTVLANIQYSHIDRAHRYCGTAVQHFEQLKTAMRKSAWPVVDRREEEFIGQLELILYEAVGQTQLAFGNPLESINSIGSMVKIVRNSPSLMQDFEAQIHTLLGFYSYFMHLPHDAENQFKAAIKTTNDTELLTVVHLSLALLYMFAQRDADFYALYEFIAPAKLKSAATSLKSAALFVQGLHCYLHMRTDECRTNLMDSIVLAKEEDMARIQAMALLLLSTTYKCRDTDVLNAACEWANKSADRGLLIWANQQICQLHSESGHSAEAGQLAANNAQTRESVENLRLQCKNMPTHRLIEWTDGNIEAFCAD